MSLKLQKQKLAQDILASLMTQDEKDAWVHILPHLNQEQVKELGDILRENKEKLNQLDIAYAQKLKALEKELAQTPVPELDHMNQKINNLIRETIAKKDQEKLTQIRGFLK